MEEHDSDVQELGSAIIKEFRAHATCLLILNHADTLSLDEKERNVHAVELGAWLRRVVFGTDKHPGNIGQASRQVYRRNDGSSRTYVHIC